MANSALEYIRKNRTTPAGTSVSMAQQQPGNAALNYIIKNRSVQSDSIQPQFVPPQQPQQPQQSWLQGAASKVGSAVSEILSGRGRLPYQDSLDSLIAERQIKIERELKKEVPRADNVSTWKKQIEQLEATSKSTNVFQRHFISSIYRDLQNTSNIANSVLKAASSTMNFLSSLYEKKLEDDREFVAKQEETMQQGFERLQIPESERQALLEKFSPRYKKDITTGKSLADREKVVKSQLKPGELSMQKLLETYVEDTQVEDPTFVDHLINGVGSMVGFMAAAFLTGGGAVVAGTLEAMQEAGSVYTENRRQDKSVDESFENSMKNFVSNVVWTILLNKLSGIFETKSAAQVGTLKKKVFAAIQGMSFEGIQESGQQLMSNATTGAEDIWSGVAMSGLVGAVLGFGGGGLSTVLAENTNVRSKTTPTQEGVTKTVEDRKAESKAKIEDALAKYDNKPVAEGEVRTYQVIEKGQTTDWVFDNEEMLRTFIGSDDVSTSDIKIVDMPKTRLEKTSQKGVWKVKPATETSGVTKLYHATDKANVEAIAKEGFKADDSGFTFFAPDEVSAKSWGKDIFHIKNPAVVEASMEGKTLVVEGELSPKQALVKAQQSLGIVSNELKLDALKTTMKEKGYSAIKFTDVTPKKMTGVRKAQTAIAVLKDAASLNKHVSEKTQVAPNKPKVISVPREQLPIGKGEKMVSALEARVKESLDAATREQMDALGETTFKQMNNKETIRKASEYVVNNQEDAMRVLKGEIPAPKGLNTNAVYVAMVNNAVGNFELATKLASLKSTAMGQNIEILKELSKTSPVRVLSDVYKIREETLNKVYKDRSVRQVMDKKVERGLKEIKAPTKADWASLIRDVRC